MYNQQDARQLMGFSDFDMIILMKTFRSQIMLMLYITSQAIHEKVPLITRRPNKTN